MIVGRVQYRSTGRPPSKSGQKYIHPRVKLSVLGRAYNKVRWTCYFLPVLGFIIIGYGIYYAIMGLWDSDTNLFASQTIIAGGAILTYLAIYYNKRT